MFFPLVFERLDIYVAVLTLWSVLLFQSKKFLTSGLVLLVGIMVKIYPLFLVPLFVYKLIRSNHKYYALFMGLVGLISIWFLTRDAYMMQFLSERSPQPESLYSLYFYIKQSIPPIIYAHNSIEYAPSHVDPYLTAVLMVSGVLGLSQAVKTRDIAVGAFYIVLGVIIGGRTLSPQYLLWLAVFLPFIDNFSRIVVFVSIILTMFYLGFYEQTVIKMDQPYFSFLLLRNILLLVVFARSLFDTIWFLTKIKLRKEVVLS